MDKWVQSFRFQVGTGIVQVAGGAHLQNQKKECRTGQG